MKKGAKTDVPKRRSHDIFRLDPQALMDHILTLPPAPPAFYTDWSRVEDYQFIRFQRWLEETGTTLGANGCIVFLERSA